MNIESKSSKLITMLIRETLEGNISWDVTSPPPSLVEKIEQSVPLFLRTEYKGKNLGIYEIRYKYFTDEDEFHWSQKIEFCIFDEKNRVIWEETECSPAMVELFKAAREGASGIEEILDDLLSD